jgi:cellulose synthase/poly-beta-1,6-N-acetylglucosamine synthase-like glycosyltransferase
MTALFYALIIFHGLTLGLLFIYGVNILYLTFTAYRLRDRNPTPPPLEDYPLVTVQLPIYNERYVAKRIIDVVCQLDWPRDRLEIQVLDDSTDNTFNIVAAAVAQHQLDGFNIQHHHRTKRTGYKAGALAEGTAIASGEFFAIFDADFIPAADFLKKTVPHFQDERIGFLQTRWEHLNHDYSLFTLLQSISIDGHFMIEQFARQRTGLLMNFNGTGGVWRRSAIEDAGGWTDATLTEDLDLSYRAQLKGWRAMYLRDVTTPGELPVTVNGYRRQQYRWARGSWECALRLLPQIWRADMPFWRKLQGTLHLTGYGIHFLMLLLVLQYPLILLIADQYPGLSDMIMWASIFNLTAAAPTIYYSFTMHEKGYSWLRKLPAVLFLNVLGAGIMVNNVRGIIHAFIGGKAEFQRTPKFGIEGRGAGQNWREKSYRLAVSPLVLVEFVILLWNLNTVRWSLVAGNYAIATYAGIFTAGMVFMLGLTAWQSYQVLRADRLARRRQLIGTSSATVEN